MAGSRGVPPMPEEDQERLLVGWWKATSELENLAVDEDQKRDCWRNLSACCFGASQLAASIGRYELWDCFMFAAFVAGTRALMVGV